MRITDLLTNLQTTPDPGDGGGGDPTPAPPPEPASAPVTTPDPEDTGYQPPAWQPDRQEWQYAMGVLGQLAPLLEQSQQPQVPEINYEDPNTLIDAFGQVIDQRLQPLMGPLQQLQQQQQLDALDQAITAQERQLGGFTLTADSDVNRRDAVAYMVPGLHQTGSQNPVGEAAHYLKALVTAERQAAVEEYKAQEAERTQAIQTAGAQVEPGVQGGALPGLAPVKNLREAGDQVWQAMQEARASS